MSSGASTADSGTSVDTLALVRALRELGATRVTVGGVHVEFGPPAEPKVARPTPLAARDRKRLAELEAQDQRLREIPGYVGGS